MTDPYRDQHYACPTCGVGLRPFAQRLVCDTCGGMLLPDADLKTSIEDLVNAPVKLQWRDAAPSRRCPQCPQMMMTSQATIDVVDQYYVTPDLALARCSEHGVWFDKNELTALFTAVERRLHKGQPTERGPLRGI